MPTVKFTKAAITNMTAAELKMAKSFEDKRAKLLDIMVKKQALYTKTSRQNPNSKQLDSLVNAGFKAEFEAFKAKEKHIQYIEKMNKKYK